MSETNDMLLYSAAQVRELDHRAVEGGIGGYELMCRAGAALQRHIEQDWPDARQITLLCGPGNNGGDGYVLGRLLRASAVDVQLLALVDPDTLQGAAHQAAVAFQQSGGRIDTYAGELPVEADLLVDAVLGTGLDRPVDGLFAQAIEQLNAHPAPVLAADIPSGLHADTGVALGRVVAADATVTFIGRKRGLYTAAGVQYVGRRVFADLDVPASVYAGLQADVALLQPSSPVMPPRPRDAHKGLFGYVLVVGGGSGMPGAVRLAAEAAARAGAGLVGVATHPQHAACLNIGRPELMVCAAESASDLDPLLARASVVVVGPGLGQSDWARTLLEKVLQSSLPLVIDADALNLLAQEPRHSNSWILTPHPGEAARLLNCSIKAVQKDRFSAVKALQAQYGGVVVLKGAGSLIAGEKPPIGLCPWGNPGMSSGGMGDVLSGLIGALLAQGLAAERAAGLAVGLHAQAADRLASAYGERGLLAGDLLVEIRRLLNGY